MVAQPGVTLEVNACQTKTDVCLCEQLKTMQSLSEGMSGCKVPLGSRKNKSKPPSISSQFNVS